ncbi:hypothetical protein BDR03DRAFT_948881 [Suillus americanus]|nr:hypothetical protein BDR03DRAFT_948881 [Suillus americanus]
MHLEVAVVVVLIVSFQVPGYQSIELLMVMKHIRLDACSTWMQLTRISAERCYGTSAETMERWPRISVG